MLEHIALQMDAVVFTGLVSLGASFALSAARLVFELAQGRG